jgi:aspartyl-tRNA(Asn)/glutamyl-tRNA(Gln) amidotransferase subunit A
VAAGLGYASLGTDTGGSIRVPAAWCGLVGVKPTYGRVSLAGVIPLATSLDHVGPLTRTARDAAIVLQAIAGHEANDPTSLDTAVPDFVRLVDDGPIAATIGVDLATYEANVDPDIFAAVQHAIETLRELGATIVPVTLPDVEQAVEAIQTTLKAEAASYHRRWLAEDAGRYSPAVRARLEGGLDVLAVDYLAAFQRRRTLRDAYLELLTTADVLLTPTTTRGPMTVTTLEEQAPSAHGDPLHQRIRFTGPINATGLPAMSLPCGMTRAGLPIGMQFVGRPLDEGRLLATADRYERAAGWSARHPQLA